MLIKNHSISMADPAWAQWLQWVQLNPRGSKEKMSRLLKIQEKKNRVKSKRGNKPSIDVSLAQRQAASRMIQLCCWHQIRSSNLISLIFVLLFPFLSSLWLTFMHGLCWSSFPILCLPSFNFYDYNFRKIGFKLYNFFMTTALERLDSNYKFLIEVIGFIFNFIKSYKFILVFILVK